MKTRSFLEVVIAQRPAAIGRGAMLILFALGLWSGGVAFAQAAEPAELAELKTKAAAGDAASMYSLALRHEFGTDMQVDYRAAAQWHEKAAAAGSLDAMWRVGCLHQAGRGLPKDALKAAAWFRQAAEAGHAKAMQKLGSCFAEGRGIGSPDQRKAVGWFQKSAQAGEPAGMQCLAVAFTTGQGVTRDIDQAKKWFQKARDAWLAAAKSGDVDAMLYLAEVHWFGSGVARDATQAAAWYLKAAKLGRVDAMLLLALMHSRGQGVAQDDKQVVHWYRQAADRGDPSAMCLLAIEYAKGITLAKDEQQSVKWCRQAAELGDAAAMLLLAQKLERGEGLKQDEKEAQTWYFKAAEWGESRAMTEIGLKYRAGRGLEKDLGAAAIFFRDAADLEDATAACHLARAYEQGEGVEKDVARAVKWYNKAAFHGQPEAMYQLGLLQSGGRGIDQDPKRALIWFRMAAAHGHQDAKRRLPDAENAIQGQPTRAPEPEKDGSAPKPLATPRSVVSPKVLSEKDLEALVELSIPDAAVRSRIQKSGVAADVDEAALQRLQKAGATEAVLAAVREAVAAKKKSAAGPPLTYDDVLRLLSLGIDEEAILRRHAKSPDALTFDAVQIAALKQAGASPKLLAALTAAAGAMEEDPSDKPAAAKRAVAEETMIPGWGEFVDPAGAAKFRRDDAALTITVPGELRDLWPVKSKVNAPLVLQDAAGDFTVEVKVAHVERAAEGTVIPGAGSTAAFHAGTLVIWQDNKNFVRLDRTDMHNKGRAITTCYLHVFQDGERTVEIAEVVPDKPTHLRLARRGDRLAASYSQDNAKTWHSFAEQQVDLANKLKVGVAALNNTTQPASAKFESLKVTTDK